MGDFGVRTLDAVQTRAANALFRAGLHVAPATDAEWEQSARVHQPGRTVGVFDPDLVGTARSFDAELAVPGGARLPMAGVTGVAVRPDRTRRGVLRALMGAQLADFAGRGVVFANLLASEAGIYGRFGFGLATRLRVSSVDRHRARLRPGVPGGGGVELLELDAAVAAWPGLYERVGLRAGMMTRPEVLWRLYENQARQAAGVVRTVVHHGPDGPDGYVTYAAGGLNVHPWTKTLEVLDMFAGTAVAFAGLWRFLLGIDLVDRVVTGPRALDEPLELLLADHRQCRVERVGDEHWVRLVDVPVALGAREYGVGAPVVVEVRDGVLPANAGTYRVSPEGAVRCEERAALVLDVAVLSMVYLGTWRPSALAAAGWIEVRDPGALVAADALFATRAQSWCGTYF